MRSNNVLGGPYRGEKSKLPASVPQESLGKKISRAVLLCAAILVISTQPCSMEFNLKTHARVKRIYDYNVKADTQV
jgi:hypothetical protein